MSKKVSELTKELDISLEELKGYADKMGIAVASARSSVEDQDAERLIRSINLMKGNTSSASSSGNRPKIKAVPVMPKDGMKAKPPIGKPAIPKKAVVPKAKEEEKPERKSTLDGIAKTMPAMARALKISKRVTRKGFEWKNRDDVIDCFKSEIEEYMKAENDEQRLEEMGDIFFSLINLARWDKVDPEIALNFANDKFIKRFTALESMAQKPLDELTYEEYNDLWQKAKTMN